MDVRNKSLAMFVVILALVFCSGPLAHAERGGDGPGTGTVMGQIGIKDVGPMMGGTIFFYDSASGPAPSSAKYWRVPTHSFRVDTNSRFTAKIPEGTYYIGAIERKSGESLGPPQEGDYFFIGRDKNGKPKELTVWSNSVVDLQMLSGAEPFTRATLAQKGITAIQGVLRDDYGQPMEGMLVFAYGTPEMFDRPLFVSERSDKNGKYLLRVAGGGRYYLKARADSGGGPSSFMGVYKDGAPLAVKKGRTRRGANITVFKVGMMQ